MNRSIAPRSWNHLLGLAALGWLAAGVTGLLAACAGATPAPSPAALLPSPAASRTPVPPPSVTSAPASTPTAQPSPTPVPTGAPGELAISPATLAQLRPLWSLYEPGNPNAQSGCQDIACWRFSRIGTFALSPDDRTLAVSVCLTDPTENTTNPRLYRLNCPGQSEVRLYDAISGELRQTLAVQDFPISLAFHPGDTLLAAGMAHRSIEVWDLVAGLKLHTLLHSTTHSGVYGLAFSPDGALLMSLGDSKIQLWDWDRTIPLGVIDSVRGFSVDPTGGHLATLFVSSDGSHFEARVYPLNDLASFRGFRLDWRRSPSRIAYTPDGSRLVAFGAAGVEVLDASSGEIVGEADFEDLWGEALVSAGRGFTPDGRSLFLANLFTADTFSTGIGLWTPLDEGAFVAWWSDEGIEDLSPFVLFDIESLTMGPAGRLLVSVDIEDRIGILGVDPSAPGVEPECLGTCTGGE